MDASTLATPLRCRQLENSLGQAVDPITMYANLRPCVPAPIKVTDGLVLDCIAMTMVF